MILSKKLGLYLQGNFTYVPYQHFIHKQFWKVLVNQKFPDAEMIKTLHFNVVAKTAYQAAFTARKYWTHYQQQQKLIEEIDAERAKKLRPSGTQGKPPLDELQLKKDQRTVTAGSNNSIPNEKTRLPRIRIKK